MVAVPPKPGQPLSRANSRGVLLATLAGTGASFYGGSVAVTGFAPSNVVIRSYRRRVAGSRRTWETICWAAFHRLASSVFLGVARVRALLDAMRISLFGRCWRRANPGWWALAQSEAGKSWRSELTVAMETMCVMLKPKLDGLPDPGANLLRTLRPGVASAVGAAARSLKGVWKRGGETERRDWL